jgi:dTDP-4-amino-4,6-dideoxygalactose transaminase
MPLPFLDLHAQYASIQDELEAAVLAVLRSGQYILGPKVEECERAVAAYSQCADGVGMSSGTDALLACLMAEGIGPGDEVITTPYTFFATAGCVARVGAKPVFVDIQPETYNIDAALIEERITPRTRALIPVHLFGQMADMHPIMDLARRHNLVVIEDAAQAIGAEYGGRRAGSIGHYGCFSFFPSKNLGCAGDGGMVVTSDAQRAERLRVLRAHGSKPKYYHKLIGGNFRLDALQAAIVTVKLRYLDQWTDAREANAARYDQLFRESGIVDDGLVQPPTSAVQRSAVRRRNGPVPTSELWFPTPRHIYNQYVIRTSRRDELRSFLTAQGIGTEIYYPKSLHEQECFSNLGYRRGDFPESERAAAETLALPVYAELHAEQSEAVAHIIAAFCRGTKS